MTSLQHPPPPPTPPGWHPDPDGTRGLRYWDGTRWTDDTADAPPPGYGAVPPRAATRRRRLWPWVFAIVVFLLIVGSVSGNNEDSNSSASSSAGTTERAPTTRSTSPPSAGIGQEARDGKLAFVVTSVDRSRVAGDPTNPYLQETAQGEFVNVHLRVTNIGDEAQTYFATNQKLIAGGKQFDANGMAALGSGGSSQEINPGLGITTVVSFDVPAGTAPDVLEVHDSAFSGGTKIGLN